MGSVPRLVQLDEESFRESNKVENNSTFCCGCAEHQDFDCSNPCR